MSRHRRPGLTWVVIALVCGLWAAGCQGPAPATTPPAPAQTATPAPSVLPSLPGPTKPPIRPSPTIEIPPLR